MQRHLPRTFFAVFTSTLLLSQSVSPSSWHPPASSIARPNVQFQPVHPWIAFTFDDGPHPAMTDQLLALLEKEQVPATFFVVGKMVDRYPDLLRHIAEGGHEISNHTYNHYRLSGLSTTQAMEELQRCRDSIRRVTGQETHLYRPPGGGCSPDMAHAAALAGYRLVLWSTISKDVSGISPDTIHERVLSSAHDGGIILMHSGMPNTLAALPGIIADLRARGYQFVTVSTLLSSRSPS